jgi:hypothetical protein
LLGTSGATATTAAPGARRKRKAESSFGVGGASGPEYLFQFDKIAVQVRNNRYIFAHCHMILPISQFYMVAFFISEL